MLPPRAPAAPGLPPEAAEIARMIAKGNAKSAVEAAKLLHKRLGTRASEELLVDAYAARVRSMLEHRMIDEAEALLRMVRERHPALASRLDGLRGARTGAGAGLDELVRPLSDATTPAETRAAIERTLRSELTDPAALAACGSLPVDDPLRCAAGAVARAFNAVTSGPVDDAALALPEVSRRSPLAPWKPLLRAIASYYRRQDAECLGHLGAIDPESAPARLIPALRALLGGDAARDLEPAATPPRAAGRKPSRSARPPTPPPLKPAAARLVAQVGGSFDEVRGALNAIDAAFNEVAPKPIFSAIRAAVPLVQQQCPAILPAFRRQVAVIAFLRDLSPEQVRASLGGSPKSDARFLLSLARGVEESGAPPAIASETWEQFRRAAIREEWFPARGPEAAVLYLHMAELAGRIDPDVLRNERHAMAQERHRALAEGMELQDAPLDYLEAETLFQHAAAMDPSAGVFERWADWAESSKLPRAAEAAAEAWRTALPTDPRPLLRLMRMAEERDALKKALGYLRQAEALDGVNAEVRRARLRLLVLGAVRHLKQKKPRLAEPELAEIETLPQAREFDRPAFVTALRYVAAAIAQDVSAMQAAVDKLHAALRHPLTLCLVLESVGGLCGVDLDIERQGVAVGWVEAIPRAYEIGRDLGFSFRPPENMKAPLLRELPTASAEALERLGKVALGFDWKDVAFAASAAGMAAGKAGEARFLLLRAGALSMKDYRRQEDCLLAALLLAKRAGDTGLAAEAEREWRKVSIAAAFGNGVPEMQRKHLERVLKRERAARELPKPAWNPFAGGFDDGPDDGPDDLDDLDDEGSPFDVDAAIPPPSPRRRRARSRSASPSTDDQETLF